MSGRSYPWWFGLASVLGAGLLVLLAKTWRLEWIGTSEREAGRQAGERWIFALWHARLLPLTIAHRHRDVGVLISQHRDGELIARIVERLGYATGRGSSTRGGEEGARDMLRLAEEGRILAITPDGPRGPAEQVKPGLVYLASRTGLPIVPVAASARNEWRMRSWDGFRIPKPFSRVMIGYGPPLAVPNRLDDREEEAWRVRLQAAIEDITRDLDRRMGQA
ncbi:MAG TPA: lysophospholipid acyltransferase family protein [Candidatus Eisenbacteria bacterium]|nr:lysophospholipid acyltransferase family protein [Candidatus Eisenbacteria bacterium]